MHWTPKRWTLVGVLLAALLTLNPILPTVTQAMTAQVIATTTIADTIYRADGTPATGSIVISWPEFTTSTGATVPAGTTSATIGAGGAFDVQLAPNAGSNPMGSYYTAVYHLDDGSVTRNYWVVPASASPVKISTVQSTVLPTSVAMQTVSKSYVDTAIAAAVSGTAVSATADDPSASFVLKTGDTMTGPLVLPADPVSTNQAADKHYVDVSVAQIASGGNGKVALLPGASQTVTQPTGTLLEVNNLNGVENASQYVTGGGNNGISNAAASPDCASGCEIKVENFYTNNESYNPATWNNQTTVEDTRKGTRHESFMNPENISAPGFEVGHWIDVASTLSGAALHQLTTTGDPSSVGLLITHEGLTGGNNLFPESIDTSVPYFKSNYNAVQLTGSYNTMGQHVLDSHSIACYGVGDCLLGSQFLIASGGLRDEADEGAHPFDISIAEDSAVFAGICTTGCTTGSTNVAINVTQSPRTQGEGRYLIDTAPAKVINAGLLTGGIQGAPYPTALFSGVTFPLSTFFATAQLAPSQSDDIAPGTVTLAIATTGVTAGFATNTAAAPATSGIACIADQNPAGSNVSPNYEMANYTVVDGTHLQLTLHKVHAPLSTIAIGGLCGYGLEQTVDTHNGIRQVFPIVGSDSSTSLFYAGGLTAVAGIPGLTSGFFSASVPVATLVRSGNVVTVTTGGGLPKNPDGLTMTVSGAADSSYNGSFVITTTSGNTATYTQTGPNSATTGGTLSVLTGGYNIFPMAEVLGVLNPATKQVDGQMTLAPNTVQWAANDPVEEPHYYQEKVAADIENISQSVPRPTVGVQAGLFYSGVNTAGLTGWEIINGTPSSFYLGGGGTHAAPNTAIVAGGTWANTMQLDPGLSSLFEVNCNLHGCTRWDSGFNLFQLTSGVGIDAVGYQPQTSIMDINMRGTDYQFSPQAFTANTINATTINAGSINGQVSGSSIAGAVSATVLPAMHASGSGHAAGIVPDPGAAAGSTRFLREDGTWVAPSGSGASGGNLLAGAIADYNFLQGAGTTATDITGNGNDGTLSTGDAAPSWTSTGLAFQPGQGVSLPAALNGSQTFIAAFYLDPLTSNTQVQNTFPLILSSSTGGDGLNIMTSYSLGNNFVGDAYAPALYVNGQRATYAPNLISGFHVLAVTLGSGAGSLDHLYVDGYEVASYTQQVASAGAQTTGNLFVGSSNANPWGGSGLLGTMYRLRAYPTQLAASDVQAVSSAIANEVALRGVPTTPVAVPLAAPQFHAIGDSITFGAGVSTPWPSLLTLTNQPAYTVTDWGITGITLTAITGSEPNRAALRCRSTSGTSVAVVFAGTNDFAFPGATPSVVFNSLMGEVQTMKQAGCHVFVGTMLSRTGSDGDGNTLDSDKDAYDTLILSQAKAGGADGVIDFAANPLLGADEANSNTTYFQADHIHPTQPGQALLASAASNALNYAFGANEASPHVVNAPNYSMTAADGYLSLSGLTGASTITLPDCTGQSGATYRINNPQSAFAVAVTPLSTGQPVNGLTTPVTVPANATLTLRDVPNPKTISGCHWEM